MKVNGKMDITGSIDGQSDVTASGASLKSHMHPGHSGGNTGTPN